LTIHRSKGLQADYVFILNNQNGKLGFPSNLTDDKVLNLLLQGKEPYEHAEERRLFYVALTRAKKYVYIITDSNSKSVFIRELEQENQTKEKREKKLICPECKKGELIVRKGPYGKFYGCSNYPLCNYTQKINDEN
jgi:DNA helicase-4